MSETEICVFWKVCTEWARGHIACYVKVCTEWIRRHIACFGEGILSGSDGILRVLVRFH